MGQLSEAVGLRIGEEHAVCTSRFPRLRVCHVHHRFIRIGGRDGPRKNCEVVLRVFRADRKRGAEGRALEYDQFDLDAEFFKEGFHQLGDLIVANASFASV